MWLLHTSTYELYSFTPGAIPDYYATLSHCWGDDEVTFADIHHWHLFWARAKRGWRKIESACYVARLKYSCEWIWIDTCCIDHSSSAELSEAINSMFTWYRRASICLVYLHDVPGSQDPNAERSAFRTSRWFTRGWTLQELIAPYSWMVFLSEDWEKIGQRDELATVIEQITRIDTSVLLSNHPFREVSQMSVAKRMSWAAGRTTTKPEDRVYSLMGIFDVHMPVIYGEGEERAFHRLQLEIIRRSSDQSIFAW
ncbi:heterokaryon incompatibility protein-domain-containing protein, partial [Trametes meyenii]